MQNMQNWALRASPRPSLYNCLAVKLKEKIRENPSLGKNLRTKKVA
jgi:hypothetical protein